MLHAGASADAVPTGRRRDECLSCEEFWSLGHARVLLEE